MMTTPSSATASDADFGILLGLAYQLFVDALHRDLGKHGFTDLSPSFGYVLRAVAAGPLTTTQLAARLQLTPQGAAKIVDEMVGNGYLQRRPDPADGRAKRLVLAPRGKRALRAARAFHRAFEADFARTHGQPRARALRDALELLVRIHAADGTDTAARFLRPV